MASITSIVERFKDESDSLLTDQHVHEACDSAGHTRRQRALGPAVTVRLMVIQMLLGNDPRKYAKHDLAELYRSRWQIKTNLKHLKTTMGMDVLRFGCDPTRPIVINPVRPDRDEPRRIKPAKDRYTYLTRPRDGLRQTPGIQRPAA